MCVDMKPTPSPLRLLPAAAEQRPPGVQPQECARSHAKPATGLRCPRCADSLQRARRTALDRVFCLFVPQLRLRCQAEFCGWQGLVRRDAPGARAFVHEKAYLPQHVLQPSRMSQADGTKTGVQDTPDARARPPGVPAPARAKR